MASHLRFKLKQEYSEMSGFVWEGMSLAMVKYNTLLLRPPHHKEAYIHQTQELTDGVVMELIELWLV